MMGYTQFSVFWGKERKETHKPSVSDTYKAPLILLVNYYYPFYSLRKQEQIK